jgi:hypothetical protein
MRPFEPADRMTTEDGGGAFAHYREGPAVKKIGEQVIPLLEGRPSFKHLGAS